MILFADGPRPRRSPPSRGRARYSIPPVPVFPACSSLIGRLPTASRSTSTPSRQGVCATAPAPRPLPTTCSWPKRCPPTAHRARPPLPAPADEPPSAHPQTATPIRESRHALSPRPSRPDARADPPAPNPARARRCTPRFSVFAKDATFCTRPGWGSVRFELYDFPGRYIRHRNYDLCLDPYEATGLFHQDNSSQPVSPWV
ncbi:AbfB domain-containing protein [Streptomyces sp. NPDC005483]|uniref:AbfB domain-containing protein n=1 Tax=Streptomyces sp. NPDC005483 TaxID=3154882 RepID=UPI0033A0AC48